MFRLPAFLFLSLLCFPALVWAEKDVPGSGHHLFVDQEGKLWAWGSNSFGQLGVEAPSTTIFPLPVAIATPMMSAATGRRHSVAVDSLGLVWVWGDNSVGQLGTRSFGGSTSPLRLGLTGVVTVAAGAWHTAALDKTGHVWAWGGNTLAQLGDGKRGNFSLSIVPQQVEGMDNVIAIRSGDHHVLALRADGTVWGWGDNRQGQLGGGKRDIHDRPGQIAGLEKIRLIGANGNASQAEGTDGSVWAWGWHSSVNEGWLTPHLLENKLPDEAAVAISKLSGRVAAGGHPVVGATVSIDARACGHTDDRGHYRCMLPAGFEGVLQAHKEGFVFAARKIGPIPAPSIVREMQGRAAVIRISGKVLGKNRLPAPGLALGGGEVKCGKTDANGLFACDVPYGWSGRLVGRGRDDSVLATMALNKVVRSQRGLVLELKANQMAGVKSENPHAKGTSELSGAKISPEVVRSAIATSAPKPQTDTVAEVLPLPGKYVQPAANVRIGGSVNLSGVSMPGLTEHQSVSDAAIVGDGAQCGKTDVRGEYFCSVPAGWTGRLAAVKRGYRFSPNAISFRDVREDRLHQDFLAVYEPD